MNFDAVEGYEVALVASCLWPAGGNASEVVDGLRELGLGWDDFGNPWARGVMRGLFALVDSGCLAVPVPDVLGWIGEHDGELAGVVSGPGLLAAFPGVESLPSLELMREPAGRVMEAGLARREYGRAARLVGAWERAGMTPAGFLRLAEEVAGEREREGEREGDGARGMRDVGKEAVAWLGERAQGGVPDGVVPTGYRRLDRLAGCGLEPGKLYVVAARPSVGKTALAVNVVRNGAGGEWGASCLAFSLEMPARDLLLRLVAMEGGVCLAKMRSGMLSAGEWGSVSAAMGRVTGWDVMIDDTGGIELSTLVRRARNWRRSRRGKRCVVVIDYAQLVTVGGLGRGANRENEMAAVSRGAKRLAKDLGVPVVLLAQLNREADKGGKPKLGQLRESGAFEQDADLVGLLHRDKDAPEKPTELIVAKNRDGETGTVLLEFVGATNEFREASAVADEDVPLPEDGAKRMRAPQWLERKAKQNAKAGSVAPDGGF